MTLKFQTTVSSFIFSLKKRMYFAMVGGGFRYGKSGVIKQILSVAVDDHPKVDVINGHDDQMNGKDENNDKE